MHARGLQDAEGLTGEEPQRISFERRTSSSRSLPSVVLLLSCFSVEWSCFLLLKGYLLCSYNKHKFPGPEKQPWVPNDRSVVCSLHFKPEDYREGLKLRRLKPDAVPSIFPGYPTYLQPAPKKERRPLKRKAATPASAAGKPPVDAKKNRQVHCLATWPHYSNFTRTYTHLESDR